MGLLERLCSCAQEAEFQGLLLQDVLTISVFVQFLDY